MTLNKRAIVVGLAKNVEGSLARVLNNFDSISEIFSDSFAVIVENDSTDGTKSILQSWTNSRKAVLVELDGIDIRFPERTERIAYARNCYLEIINNSELREFDYLIVLDMDTPNTAPLNIADFTHAIEFLEETPDAAAVFSNNVPIYYDIWALREKSWSPGDCWREVENTQSSLGYQHAVERHVRSKQIFIDPTREPIEVDSAFGGLGVYKLSYALQSSYVGRDADGSPVCEHVTYHKRMRDLGKHLYILPSLLNLTSFDHTSLPLTHALMPIKAQGKSVQLLAGKDHQLGNFRQSFPLYDERFPMLSAIFSRNSRGTIMDIGANIGDGLVLARLHGCKNKYICVEGYEPFVMLLVANTVLHRELVGEIEIVDRFINAGHSQVAIAAESGTASLLSTSDASSAVAVDRLVTLDEVDDGKVGLIKIDTDGNDASIILHNIDYIKRRRPVLWAEAEVRTASTLQEWEKALSELSKIYKYAAVFDNFGFTVAVGQLQELTPAITVLLRYVHNQRAARPEFSSSRGPTLYYTDIAFFSERDEGIYKEFVKDLQEVGVSGSVARAA